MATQEHGKKYRAAAAQYDRDQLHSPADAVARVKSLAAAKFDETVEVAVLLGLDPKKSDQTIRGTVSMPSGTARPCAWPSSPPATPPRRPARPAPTSSAATTSPPTSRRAT
jgi:hypothetical protein